MTAMKPLKGLRMLVTRAAQQAEELAHPLREYGADVIAVPVIGIAPPGDTEPLRTAARCNAYDWIVFTSANAVAAFAAELQRAGVNGTARVATVGSATREAAKRHGLDVALTPEKYVAESLVEAFASEELAGRRILIPTAAVTRDVVAPALRERGARVDIVEAYRNIVPPEASARVRAVFTDSPPDWITVTSSSAVTNLVALAEPELFHRSKLASIGPITSETARSHRLIVHAEANPHNIKGLVDALVAAARK